jgi:hypothetical protein
VITFGIIALISHLRKGLFRWCHFFANGLLFFCLRSPALFALALAPPELEVRALCWGAWPIAESAALHIAPGAPQVFEHVGVVIAARHTLAHNAFIRDDFSAVSEYATQATLSEPMAFFNAWIQCWHYLFSSIIAARQKATTTMTKNICIP